MQACSVSPPPPGVLGADSLGLALDAADDAVRSVRAGPPLDSVIWPGTADKGAMAGVWVAGAAMAEGGSELAGIGALWVVAAAAAAARLGLRRWRRASLLPAAGLRRLWRHGVGHMHVRRCQSHAADHATMTSASCVGGVEAGLAMTRLAAAAARQRWRSVSIGHVRFPACPQFINGGTEQFRRSHIRDAVLRP